MLPKVSILNLDFGRYMVLPNDEGLIRKLLHLQSFQVSDPIVQISTAILEKADNKVMIDIGANAGSFTIPLARLFDQQVNFYCFEVQRMVFNQLCGNIFLNSLDNVTAFNVAVSNKNGFILIPTIENYKQCGNIGGFSIDEFSLKANRPDFPNSLFSKDLKEKVACRTLDSMTDIPAAGLIKIDVEGHELDVLEGSIKYIQRSGYPPIIFEAWDYEWYKPKFERLVRFLNSIGYHDISNETSDNNYLAQSDLTSGVKLSFRNLPEGKQIVRHAKRDS